MPAVSKKQQRFFGMVRAAQKGELENPSPEVADVANDISVKDAKKFAKTKHKGLPEKKKMQEGISFSGWRKKASGGKYFMQRLQLGIQRQSFRRRRPLRGSDHSMHQP